MPKRSSSLAGRLMAAQLLVIGAGGISLVVAATLIAPRQFRTHLALAGENAPEVTKHAEAAFSSAFSASLAVALVAALTTAAVVSWFLVRRVTRPVEELARAADSIAAGEYRVAVPSAGLGSELGRLSDAFIHMTGRLSDADAARSRLLADLAHELRTPLATLEAYIDGMEDGVVPEDAASWSTMRGQVARLHRLATDLREVASAEEHTLVSALRPTSVDEVCDAAIASARPRYQAGGVALTFVGPARMPEVLADAGRLHQVLVNLLDNALRHTADGGHVELRATPRHGGRQPGPPRPERRRRGDPAGPARRRLRKVPPRRPGPRRGRRRQRPRAHHRARDRGRPRRHAGRGQRRAGAWRNLHHRAPGRTIALRA